MIALLLVGTLFATHARTLSMPSVQLMRRV